MNGLDFNRDLFMNSFKVKAESVEVSVRSWCDSSQKHHVRDVMCRKYGQHKTDVRYKKSKTSRVLRDQPLA